MPSFLPFFIFAATYSPIVSYYLTTKKITFLIKIDNPIFLKYNPTLDTLSFFMGEAATDERLIDFKDLKHERMGQTKEDIPPLTKFFFHLEYVFGFIRYFLQSFEMLPGLFKPMSTISTFSYGVNFDVPAT